ncbi:PDZ and LIM domain protein Zasp isoform X4 [Thrips palmi]|uniref:PDZ and LIM domain protein Zasp isoform X4 n=1 Tax=Thrips palmi TaxID=161013 RepID=A0A6P9AH63_THRPL|nr:PDZ and LIM domain protein Zasp isoform X4 [Thrips palmi]
MAQLISVKLSRYDNSPWGFRLQGGKDFGTPLIIQKVNGGSPAEKAGLQAGDAVLRINNVDATALRHKDAQDVIVRAGNSYELAVQRGGVGMSTWKPHVAPVGPSPVKPGSQGNVTKTSLTYKGPAAQPIGTGHNTSAKPFGTIPHMNGGPDQQIVNKQFNSPIGIYSEQAIAETLSAQAEVLSGGAIGVNFKKNEKEYNAANSEVLKMVQEADKEPRLPEPDSQGSGVVGSPGVGGPAPVAGGVPTPFGVHGLRHVQAPESKAPSAPQDPFKVLPPGQNICADCERLIVGVFVRIKDKNLHVECFKCATCGTPLKNVGYYNLNNKLYCDIHAKLVARQNPPAPNLEPVTVPPGARPPAGTISNALAGLGVTTGPPSAAPLSPSGGLSPQPGVGAPLPFHKGLPATDEAPASDAPDSTHGPVLVPQPPVEAAPSVPPAVSTPFRPSIVAFTPAPFKPSIVSSTPAFKPSVAASTPDPFKPFVVASTPASVEPSVVASTPASFKPSVVASTPAPFKPSVVASIPASFKPSIVSTTPALFKPSVVVPASAPTPFTPSPFRTPVAPRSPPPSPTAPGSPPALDTLDVTACSDQATSSDSALAQALEVLEQELANQMREVALKSPIVEASVVDLGPPHDVLHGPVPVLVQKAPRVGTSHVSAPKPQTPSAVSGPRPFGSPIGAPSAPAQAPSNAFGRPATEIRDALDRDEYPVCIRCNSEITRGPFITALGKIWCPHHFVCTNAKCARPLQDIGFVEEKGCLYCEYCFEQFIAPPCDKCGHKIKGDCLNAIGKHFHPECFNCVYCGKLFGNSPFFLEDGQPYCENDWNELFTTKCFACGFPIEAGDRWVEALSNNYHSQCFNCSMCKKNLEGQSFFAKGGRPFCKNHAR